MAYLVVKVCEDGMPRIVEEGLDAKEAIRLARISTNANPETIYYVMDEEELKIHFSNEEEGAYVVH